MIEMSDFQKDRLFGVTDVSWQQNTYMSKNRLNMRETADCAASLPDVCSLPLAAVGPSSL